MCFSDSKVYTVINTENAKIKGKPPCRIYVLMGSLY